MNHFGLYARGHENYRNMSVIAPRRAVHGCDGPLVNQEPIGLLDDVDITGAANVLIVADLCGPKQLFDTLLLSFLFSFVLSRVLILPGQKSPQRADQVSKYVILGGRCDFVAFGFYGLGDSRVIGTSISEVIYENAGCNGQSRQTEYHPFARKASFWGCQSRLAVGWPFLFFASAQE